VGDLFHRDAVLTVSGIRISAQNAATKELQPMLRFIFKVVKTLSKEPNTAEVSIYNLSASNRARLQTKNLPVSLDVGYVGNVHQIFSGVLQYGQSSQQGTDWVTTMQSADGAQQFKSARINVGLKGPVSVTQALNTVAEALGVPLGNVAEKAAAGSQRPSLTQFVKGLVLSGKAEEQLDKVVKSLGYSWSLQDGALQILGPKETVSGQVISLEVGTGLVGSPQLGEDGAVKARSLMQTDLLPGRRVQILSRLVNGFFRIEKVTFEGDTWGVPWYADIEAKPI
jgi:hypothetical protein